MYSNIKSRGFSDKNKILNVEEKLSNRTYSAKGSFGQFLADKDIFAKRVRQRNFWTVGQFLIVSLQTHNISFLGKFLLKVM